MNAEELKVVLHDVRRIYDTQAARASYRRDEQEQRRAEEVCVKRGEHEYRDVSPGNVRDERCKFCGKIKGPI